MPPPRRTGQGHTRVSTPFLPGGRIEDGGDGRCTSSVGFRKVEPPPLRKDAAHFLLHAHLPRVHGLFKAYTPSEQLHLIFREPRRLAAHASATLFPEDRRVVAVDFILEKQITGAFLARYIFELDK
jgi:hypothetical protein